MAVLFTLMNLRTTLSFWIMEHLLKTEARLALRIMMTKQRRFTSVRTMLHFFWEVDPKDSWSFCEKEVDCPPDASYQAKDIVPYQAVRSWSICVPMLVQQMLMAKVLSIAGRGKVNSSVSNLKIVSTIMSPLCQIRCMSGYRPRRPDQDLLCLE